MDNSIPTDLNASTNIGNLSRMTEIDELCHVFGSTPDIVRDTLPFFNHSDHVNQDSTGAFLISRIIQTVFHASSKFHPPINDQIRQEDSSYKISTAEINDQRNENNRMNHDPHQSFSSKEAKARALTMPSISSDKGSSTILQRIFPFGGKKINNNFDHVVFSRRAVRKNMSSKWFGAIGIATDLSELQQLLSDQGNNKCASDEFIGKSIVESLQCCLKLLEKNDESLKKTLKNVHEKYFVNNNTKNPPPQSKPDTTSIENLQDILCSTLHGIINEVEIVASLLGDFNYLWNITCNTLGPYIDIDSMKEFVWILQALFSTSKQSELLSNPQVYREKRLLTIAASIFLIACDDDLSDSQSSKKQKIDQDITSSVCSNEEHPVASLSMMINPGEIQPFPRYFQNSKYLERIAEEIQVSTMDLLEEIEKVSDFVSNQLYSEFSKVDKKKGLAIDRRHAVRILKSHVLSSDAREEALQNLRNIRIDGVIDMISSTKADMNNPSSIKALFSSVAVNEVKFKPNLFSQKSLMKNPKLTLSKALHTKSIVSSTSSSNSSEKSFPTRRTSRHNVNESNEVSLLSGSNNGTGEVSSSSGSNNGAESDNIDSQELSSYKQNPDFLTISSKLRSSMVSNSVEDLSDDESISLSDWVIRLYEDDSLQKPSRRLKYFINKSESSQNGKGAIWKEIVSTLNTVLNSLVDNLYPRGEGKEEGYSLVSPAGALLCNENISGNSLYSNLMDSTAPKKGRSNFSEEQTIVLTSLMSLYYISLEQILATETHRLQTTSHSKLLKNDTFHRSLLAICCECIVKVYHPNFTTESILNATQIDGYELFKVMELFMCNMSKFHSFNALEIPDLESKPPIFLPDVIVKYLLQRELEMLESGVWMSPQYNDTGGLINAIASLHQTQSGGLDANAWPPPCLEYIVDIDDDDDIRNLPVILSVKAALVPKKSTHSLPVELILRKTLIVSARRILQLAHELNIVDCHVHRIWVALRFLLRNHIYILYDHHIDQIMLCSLYGVCKISFGAPEITFSRIIEVYKKLNKSRGDICNQKIIRHILLEETNDGTLVFGNIIQFYNDIYVPTMKPHLLKNSDTEFLARQKLKTSRVMRHIVKSSKFSHWNASSDLWRGARKCKFENVVVTDETDTSSSNIEIPRGRVFYTFGSANSKNIERIRRAIPSGDSSGDDQSDSISSKEFENVDKVTV